MQTTRGARLTLTLMERTKGRFLLRRDVDGGGRFRVLRDLRK